jgi:hypothetical protein
VLEGKPPNSMTELLAIMAPAHHLAHPIARPHNRAEIAAKSLRKAQTAIRDVGTDNIALVLQGLLVAGDHVAEAGLSALPKVHQKARKPIAPSHQK